MSFSFSWKEQGSRYILGLAVITFVAHFWHYNNLGLYEDDYFLIAQPMSMNMDEIGEFMTWHIFNFNATEARPLLYIIEFSVGLLGKFIGDFHGLYWINYGVILINNILMGVFLKSLWNQPIFVITGTLGFTLFPAETTHAYLTHISLYSSLTLLLLAFLSYLSHKKLLSYLLIFSSLLCYETVFPVFITAPLFKNKWDRTLFQKMLRHTLILAAMLGVIVIARKITGESRIEQLDFLTLISTPVRQMLIGPFVSLSMFFYRPAQTLLNLNGELLIIVPLFFVGFILLFSNLKTKPDSDFYTEGTITVLLPIKKLTILGLTLLILAYPLNFTRAATAINGRDSRVHMTAAIGAAILVGLFCYLIVNIAKHKITQTIVNSGLAVFFSLLVGFCITVQHENQLSWDYQRAFWTDVIHLCPDITPNTIILVDAPLNTGKQLHSFIQWGVPMTLRQIYKFPKTWERLDELPKTDDQPRWYFWRKYTLYPKVYRLKPNWQNLIINQSQFDFSPKNKAFDYFLQWEPPRLVDSHNIILLETRNDQLVRRIEPLMIGDRLLEFQPISPSTLDSFQRGVLYNSLIQPDNQAKINYLNQVF
ncbi:hypothetical protein [Coleofasciculus sp. G2-EDA-02]|uniref:hypothetical protein n=1 Tax=Coleofasciculus sp. G2-EDA-02 TaxID=3069529 RepID=UPI0032FCE1BB